MRKQKTVKLQNLQPQTVRAQNFEPLNTTTLPQLPKGWVWTKLGSIASIQGGFAFKSTDYKNKGVPLLRISNIKGFKVSFDEDAVFLDKNFIKEYSDFLISRGDILIALSGATTGKYGVYDKDEKALLNQRVGQIKPWDGTLISSRLIFYYLSIIRGKILNQAYGMAQPNISTRELQEISFPLPPLPEQHRIVAKIEELFTKLDAGVEALKKIKAQLKLYRQAVLKYAFDGKLTKEWREKRLITAMGKKDYSDVEPASVLLEKIKEQRKKDAKGKYKELPPVDTTNLPELPDGWVWTRLEDISSLITKGESPKWQGFNYVNDGIYFLRSENVLWGNINITNVVKIPDEFHKKLKRSQVKPNDVLLNLVGASIGRTGIVPQNIKNANINQAVALIRTNKFLIPSYLMYLLLSPQLQKIIHGSKVETARPNISLEDVRHFEIPLPPLPEQHKIVEEIERRFSVADEVEKIVEQSLKQAERLRQSILKKAFEGKLVPQDPTDLPAAELLDQIKRKRESLVCQQTVQRQPGKRSKNVKSKKSER